MPLFAILALGLLTMWVPSRWALSAFELAILAGTAVQLLRQRLHPTLESTLLAAVIAWGGAQLLAGWTADPFRTREELLNWTIRLCAFSWALTFSADQRRRFLSASLILAAALALLGMLTVFSSPPGVIFWTTDVGTGIATLGPFVYRNQFAAFMELLLPVALYRSLHSRSDAWLYAGAAGLMTASVVAAGSRAGAVLCFLEIFAVLLFFIGKSEEKVKTSLRPVGMVLAAVGFLTLVAGWSRLATRFEEANPYALRWDLTLSSIEMFRSRPLTGWGLGTWSAVYPGFARFDDGTFVNQAHNEWVQWLAEGGILLFLLVLIFAARLIRPALRNPWALGALAVFVHALVDYPFEQRPQLAIFFFVFFGFVASQKSLRSLS